MVIKYNFLFLFSLFLSVAVCAQTPDCNKFKEGTFIYPTLPGKKSVRKGKIQESWDYSTKQMIWSVKWVNDCEYILTFRKALVKDINFRKGDKIHVKIVRTEGNCYLSELTFYNRKNPKGLRIEGGELCLQQ
ncbi:MAG: hypothetical protein IT233_11755 [Bacteroidia bacterium]|nr:hypothetical protein [Bacteroidia bacterium]